MERLEEELNVLQTLIDTLTKYCKNNFLSKNKANLACKYHVTRLYQADFVDQSLKTRDKKRFMGSVVQSVLRL